MPNCRKCGNHFPTTIKIDGVKHTLCSRKFCLVCSPFKSHNTRKLVDGDEFDAFGKRLHPKTKRCPNCKLVKPIDAFYFRKDSISTYSWCQTCDSKRSLEKKRILKQKCIDYLGGKCLICGYNKCMDALVFHHRDGDDKDFGIATAYSQVFSKIKPEIDKCDLVCNRCHSEIHYELNRLAMAKD